MADVLRNMRTLHLYLTRQVLWTLLMTVAVFTFVLLLTNLLKEILALLVSHQATLWVLAKAVALLLPFVVAFALPMGMLTAALLVFGRFSADQELTAARASGLSLVSLITPVLLLSLALSLLCGWVNLEIAPRCRVEYKRMLFDLGFDKSASFIEPDRYVDLPGWVVYASKTDGNHLEGVRLYQVENDTIKQSITASDGLFVINPATRQLLVTLTNATVFQRIRSVSGSNAPAKDSTSSFREWQPAFSEIWENDPINLKDMSADARKPKLSDMSFRQLRAEIRKLERLGIDPTPAQVQLHREVAFSFASLAFTLIGIPLGVRTHRRETTAGIAMALLLVLVYYSFVILAQAWEARPELAPQLVVWLPNFLFQAVGAVLLFRANRGV